MPTANTSTRPETMFCKRRFDTHQLHAGLQRLHDQRAEHGAGNRADAAGKRGAADDRGCDDVKFVQRAKRVGRRVKACGGDRAGDPAKDAHEDEHLHDDPAGVDAAELGRLRIAAEREHVAAEARPVGDEGHDDRNAERDQNRDCDPERNEEASVRPGNIVRGRILACEPDRHRIGVDDGDRRDDGAAADRRKQDLRPDRAQGKVEALPLAATGQDADQDADTGNDTEGPARRRSDRAGVRRRP